MERLFGAFLGFVTAILTAGLVTAVLRNYAYVAGFITVIEMVALYYIFGPAVWVFSNRRRQLKEGERVWSAQ